MNFGHTLSHSQFICILAPPNKMNSAKIGLIQDISKSKSCFMFHKLALNEPRIISIHFIHLSHHSTSNELWHARKIVQILDFVSNGTFFLPDYMQSNSCRTHKPVYHNLNPKIVSCIQAIHFIELHNCYNFWNCHKLSNKPGV